jgi:hypothetical protein
MKYKADLSRPFDEATTFLNDIEAQFNTLCNGPSRSQVYGLPLPLSLSILLLSMLSSLLMFVQWILLFIV